MTGRAALIALLIAVLLYLLPEHVSYKVKQVAIGPIVSLLWRQGLLWDVAFPPVRGYHVIRRFKENAMRAYTEFVPHLRDTDIILTTYPRSGTHMTAVLISEVLAAGMANFTDLNDVVWGIELVGIRNQLFSDANASAGRRVFMTHLNAEQLGLDSAGEVKGKFIVPVRDPVHVACSLGRILSKIFGPATPPMLDYLRWLTDKGLGQKGWSDWHLNWWDFQQKHGPERVLILEYSKVVADMDRAAVSLANFLGVTLSADERKSAVHRSSLSFEKQHKRHGQIKRGFLSPPQTEGGFWGLSFGDTKESRCGGLAEEEANAIRARLAQELRTARGGEAAKRIWSDAPW
jgi:hypothetical protein